MIQIKRAYDPVDKADGVRILVDKLWPRGLTKEKAQIGLWLKEIAPSTSLRQRYHSDEITWDEFKQNYFDELAKNDEQVRTLKNHLNSGKVTFVFSSKNLTHNNAVALKEFLDQYANASRN